MSLGLERFNLVAEMLSSFIPPLVRCTWPQHSCDEARHRRFKKAFPNIVGTAARWELIKATFPENSGMQAWGWSFKRYTKRSLAHSSKAHPTLILSQATNCVSAPKGWNTPCSQMDGGVHQEIAESISESRAELLRVAHVATEILINDQNLDRRPRGCALTEDWSGHSSAGYLRWLENKEQARPRIIYANYSLHFKPKVLCAEDTMAHEPTHQPGDNIVFALTCCIVRLETKVLFAEIYLEIYSQQV